MTPALFRFGTYYRLNPRLPTTPAQNQCSELTVGMIRAAGLSRLRPAHHHVVAHIEFVWLVTETHQTGRHTSTFERIQELPLRH
ncbi:hypothetical protein [Streptomyces sp. GQFP]|uniref:hypothetical protein n=1 Tax=Streptomyces sp. GQFP TaxID=2907545 RepID=UPI001F2EEF3F|nr:hypothetical protein [Streptomyces sp. GQFP]UIX34503.1 hypothetical protein LUX31_33350 [Streptomyces sp. GQFP]